MTGQWVSRSKCNSCGSSKGLNQHVDGHAYCFSCNKWFKGDVMQSEKVINMTDKKDLSWTGTVSAIPDRRIDEDVVKRYDSLVKKNNGLITHHIYKYYNLDGSHTASKIRQVEGKKIWSEGNMGDALLFGQNLFNSGGKIITVAEGELDAMSVYQMMGKKYPAISIKNGVHSAVENCKQALEYLQSFETVVLCFDNDDQGKEATQQVAQLFEPNKCKIMKMALKDANEYLKMGRAVQFTNEFWNAQPYTPAGIINLGELGASLYEEEYCETVLYPWTNMNTKTYGMRTGELLTFTSGAGMGKSSIMRELMYHIMKTTKENTICIYAVREIVKIDKMFAENTGGELQCITLEKTDLKFIKKDLSIHDSDIDHDSQTVAFVMINNDEKIHLMWFKLDNYVTTDFDSWKMIKETTEYK